MGLQLADRSDFTGDSSLAGLNLYSAHPDAFNDGTTQIAGLFAVHAGHALGRSTTEQHLTETFSTRKTIGQALGIIMERYQISEQQAFTFLVRTSQTTNIKLRVIASEVVDTLDRKGAAAAPHSTPVNPASN